MDRARAQSDLEYIRHTMQSVRRRNTEDGIYSVIWGILVPVCTALNWWLGAAGVARSHVVWWVGMPVGGMVCAFVGYRRGRGESRKPLMPEARMYYTVGALLLFIWLITYVIGLVFRLFSTPQSLYILGLLLSVAYCLQAAFGGIKGLYLLALGWLVVAILQLLLPWPLSSLVFGFSFIPLQLVPGLVLTRMYRREHDGVT